MPELSRRHVLTGSAAVAALATTQMAEAARPAGADGFKYEIQRTDAEWREQLSDFEYKVLREGATETRKSSPLWAENATGTYLCKGCDLPLYESGWKEILSIGWVFFRHSEPNAVLTGLDWPADAEQTPGSTLAQIEAHCRRCGSHLGHIVFAENKLLHCINGTALKFVPTNA